MKLTQTYSVKIDGMDETYQLDQDGCWYDQTGNQITDGILLSKISDAVSAGSGTMLQVDNEDLKESGGVVSFKDKQQDSAGFSGYGRVYLRKNVANGINLLTSAMFTQPKTRYIIQYDYDLNNAAVMLPADVILDFQGGSFKNGEIGFNNTTIAAPLYRIFRNVTFSGIVVNDLFNAGWAFDGTGTEDNTAGLNSLIPVLSKTAATLKFQKGTYNTRYIRLYSDTILAGNIRLDNKSIIRYIGSRNDDFVYANATNLILSNVQVKDLQFDGMSLARYNFNLSAVSNSVFENILSRECTHAHIYANSSLNGDFSTYFIYNTFRNMVCYNGPATLSEYGIRIVSSCNSNRFYDCRVCNAKIGIAVEDKVNPDGVYDPDAPGFCNNNMFVSCACEPTRDIAVYVNSESNLFLGMRLESGMRGIVLGTDVKTQGNVFIGITTYSFSGELYTDPTRRNLFIRRKGETFYTESLEVDNLVSGLLKSVPSKNWVVFEGKDNVLSPFDINGQNAVLRRNFKSQNGDFQHVLGNYSRGGLYEQITNVKSSAYTRFLQAKGENPYWEYQQPVKLKVYPNKASIPVIINGDPIGNEHKGLVCIIGDKLAVWNGTDWVTNS